MAHAEKGFAADSPDMKAERMEQGDSDLHTAEGSHCPLEPYGLALDCQTPCELEGP
jgi:hypothetical protein